MHARCPVADLLHGLIELCLAAPRDKYARILCDKALSCRQPNSTIPAGYNCGFAFEFPLICSLLLDLPAEVFQRPGAIHNCLRLRIE